MKKLTLLIFPLIALMMTTGGCSYDDKDLWDAVDNLDYRIEELEKAVKSLSDQTSALQQILDGKLFIESVEDDGQGTVTLHLISSTGELSTITITDGKDGEDGKTPSAPNIGVTQDGEGNWFWTIDGEPLLDPDGNRVPVNGTDGVDGTDGKTPTFKIEDGKWWISFDNGLNWTGPYGQATGADGDAFFKDATLSADGKSVILTLVDGSTLTLPIYKEFNLAFDIDGILIYGGQTKEIPFKVTGATEGTIVEAVGKNGWKASIEQTIPSAGLLKVTAPADNPGTGRVIVFAGDGADHTIMRTLTFVAGDVAVSTSSIDMPRSGGTSRVTVQTNIDFTAEIEEDARPWLSLIEGRAYELRTEEFSVTATANSTPYARTGRIYLKHDGQVIETILVVQAPVTYDAAHLVLRVDPSLTNGSITLPYLITDSEAVTTIDWGDGTPEEQFTGLNKSTTVKHTYADVRQQYSVVIKGQLKMIEGSQFYPDGTSNGIVDIIQWGKMPYTSILLDYFHDLRHIPAPEQGVFSNVSSIKFRYCSKLESVHPDLLKGMDKLTNMMDFLREAKSLKEIPDGFFDDCVNVTNFCETLKGCSSLRRLPDMTGLTLKKHANFRSTFSDCTSLTELPERLFNDATMAMVDNMSGMFLGCSSLETIPDGFFKGMTDRQFDKSRSSDASLAHMFSGCSSLRKLPIDFLFNTAAKKCSDFKGLFNGCASLTQRPAPLELTVNGTTYKIEPWERMTYLNHDDLEVRQAARDAWWPYSPGINTTINAPTGQNCFSGCTTMPGYYSEIPQAWGGGWDGSTAPPVLRVTGTPRPGAEYYAIDFKIKGQHVTNVRYYLTAKVLLDALAPKYNNDYTAIVNALGQDIEPQYIAAVNSSEGLTLGFSEGVPEVEYSLIVSATNSHGSAFQSVTTATTAMPKGEDAYEKLIGTWRVTSSNSCTAVAKNTGDVTFDIEILPLRVNESYTVSGWGISIYRNETPTIWRYENGKGVVYSGNAGKGMRNVLAYGVNYKDDFGDIDYNCCIDPYADLGDGSLSLYIIGIEPLFSVTPDASGNSATMNGLESEIFRESGMPGITCRGMEAALAMGGPGWSRIFTPVEIYLPEYTITSNGKKYAKMSLEPYRLSRITTESQTARLRRLQPGNRSLRLDNKRPQWHGTPLKVVQRLGK